jgi:hypothetical protein
MTELVRARRRRAGRQGEPIPVVTRFVGSPSSDALTSEAER